LPAGGTSPDDQRPRAWLGSPRRCTSPGLQGPWPPETIGAVFRALCVQHLLTSTGEEARVNGRQAEGRRSPAVSRGQRPCARHLRKCCSGSARALERGGALASPVLCVIATLAEDPLHCHSSVTRDTCFFPPLKNSANFLLLMMPRNNTTDCGVRFRCFPHISKHFSLSKTVFISGSTSRRRGRVKMRWRRDSSKHSIITAFDAGISRLQSQMGQGCHLLTQQGRIH